jgi:hypothetical protein
VVLVVQIVSGGVGLNLQFCSRVLFLSQHWNPAVVHQAVGRAVRIGQKEVVRVYMYRIVDDVMDNLDLRMSDVHAGKIVVARELCASFYEGFWGGSNGLTDIAGTVDGGSSSSQTDIAVERLSSDALSIDRASTGLLDNPGNSRPVGSSDAATQRGTTETYNMTGDEAFNPASLLRTTIERTGADRYATETYLYRLALAKLNATG